MLKPLIRSRNRLVAISFGLIAIPVALSLAAQPEQRKPEPSVPLTADATNDTAPRPLITKVYDVADLIVADIPDFTNAPVINSVPAGGLFSGAERVDGGKTHDARLDDIAKLIQTTVEPDSWREVGGQVGRMPIVGRKLVITHDAEAHKQIEALLADFRLHVTKSVRVSAHWVLADRSTIAALRGESKGAALLTVTEESIEKLPGVRGHLRGEIVCMDGQRVFMSSVDSKSALTDGTIDVQDVSARFSELVEEVDYGAVLELCSKLSHDGQTSLVTLIADINDATIEAGALKLAEIRVSGASTTRPTASVTQSAPVLDRKNRRSHLLQTTVRVPVRTLTLVGGMSVDATSFVKPEATAQKNAAATPVDPPQIYLFISVTPESTPKK